MYAMPISKIIFKLYKHDIIHKILDTHFNQKDLFDLRERGGNHEFYFDALIPVH